MVSDGSRAAAPCSIARAERAADADAFDMPKKSFDVMTYLAAFSSCGRRFESGWM